MAILRALTVGTALPRRRRRTDRPEATVAELCDTWPILPRPRIPTGTGLTEIATTEATPVRPAVLVTAATTAARDEVH